MSIINLRKKFLQGLEQQINKELSELEIPPKFNEIEKSILAGREEKNLNKGLALIYDPIKSKADFLVKGVAISASEKSIFGKLRLNNAFRLRELQRAMGMVLLFNNVIDMKTEVTLLFRSTDNSEDNPAEYSEPFWSSYGDFQIRSCSLLDSIGTYLSFVFFGLVDAPLYYNQVIEAIKLKYAPKKERMAFEDPFQLKGRESWDNVLFKAVERYSKVRKWRDEIIHVFSPLMYRLSSDISFDQEQRKILRTPSLKASKVLEECKNTYYILRLVPLAADDLAAAYVGSDSYHRNF